MSDGTYGTEAQRTGQRKSDRLVPWILATPGACITGRSMATDDFRTLGWEVIREHLIEDGFFGFRRVPTSDLDEIKAALSDLNATLQIWRGFLGDAASIRAATTPQPLPADLSHESPTIERIPAMQAFLASHGIAPLSVAMFSGALVPTVSRLITTPDGKIAAAGWGGMLANAHSPDLTTAWAGLIAVDPEFRGQGLGRHMNHAVMRACLDDLGATGVMEFAAADNAASIAMILSSGLSETDRVSAVAMLGAATFTR